MQDLRLAVRALRATPIVTAVAVLSLALGIGANTAIFSLVNTLLLRALPVANPERLVSVSTGPTLSYRAAYSYATFDQIRRHGQPFDGALAYDCCAESSLTIGAETQTVFRLWVSGDFFTTLGVPALLGRAITPADDVPGGGPDGPVVMISYGLWQERFGGAAGVIGTPITIERVPVTIVGVTPPDFFGMEVGRTFDVALPINAQPLIQPSLPFDPDVQWLSIMLRLKPGQSLAAATAALRAMQPQIRAGAMPRTFQAPDFLKYPFALDSAGMGTSALRQRFERPLVTIFVVVGLVLLIACANIANLQLARGAARRHELSVRLALGASRWRLSRPLLIESIVLALIGATLGLLFAVWASRALVAQLSTSVTRIVVDPSLDWHVLAFTAATMVLTVMIFGLAPALRATRVAPMEALQEHGRGAAGDVRANLSSGLVVAQVALSLLLVVAAGLFVRTFEQLSHAPLGFDRDRVLVVTVNARTVPAAARNPLYHRLVRVAAAVSGVVHAGGSLNPPIVGPVVGDYVVSEPGTKPRPDADAISQSDYITPGWLAAYGTAVRSGRDINDYDTKTARPVILVNEAFARRYSPDRPLIDTAIALTFRTASSGDFPVGTKTVVGIVNDAVYRSIREPPKPTIYFPLAQQGLVFVSNFYIAVRSSTGSPALLARSVTSALNAVNPDLNLTVRPLADQVGDSLAQDRLVAILAGFFGALALLLAGLGLYGITAYAVARRRREIGIRIVLGAAPAGVVRFVLLRVSILVGVGVLLGAGISLWVSKFVATLLYGLEPRDPTTLVGAIGVLVGVAALAGWLPARSASRIDPAEVLRSS